MDQIYRSEAHLQSLCTKRFHNTHLDDPDALILIFNNPANSRMAGIMKAMGLSRGQSDQLWFSPQCMVWIEYKLPGEVQSNKQLEFEERVKRYGCKYELVHSETEFDNIINKYENGIQTQMGY